MNECALPLTQSLNRITGTKWQWWEDSWLIKTVYDRSWERDRDWLPRIVAFRWEFEHWRRWLLMKKTTKNNNNNQFIISSYVATLTRLMGQNKLHCAENTWSNINWHLLFIHRVWCKRQVKFQFHFSRTMWTWVYDLWIYGFDSIH